MLCEKPFKNKESGLEVGCGYCLPCRINRKKIWTTRLFLEGSFHSSSCFVTLTYRDELLPTDKCVSPGVAQEFLSVVRLFYPSIPYYLVGEYGKQRLRPHYHALFFGVNLSKAALDYIWQKGFTDSSPLNVQTAAYVAGYIADKLETSKYEAKGLEPPFQRCSPGIGLSAIPMLKRVVDSKAGQDYVARFGDVPIHVRFDNKIWPIGRFMAEKLRQACNIENKEARQSAALLEQDRIEATPELFDHRENLRLVARDRSAQWHRRRREKLRL